MSIRKMKYKQSMLEQLERQTDQNQRNYLESEIERMSAKIQIEQNLNKLRIGSAFVLLAIISALIYWACR